MTPPITTHQELVLVERAHALARAEKSRQMRDQEDVHMAHIESKAGHEVGLSSLRSIFAGLATRHGQRRIASAHR